MQTKYLYPEYEAGKHLFHKNIQGPLINLNLIRLKAYADYSSFPDLQPAAPISGMDAFLTYVEAATPFLSSNGGEILFIGKGDRFLIGPANEYWHVCMLIKQRSVQDFFAFENNAAYMKIAGHRMAAIEDSRLLPLESL